MNDTSIAWTDLSWNPTSGCAELTEGCKFCYAKTRAERLRGTSAFPNGFDLTYRPHKLKEPFAPKYRKLAATLGRPVRVFVNSMSDLFWEEIDDTYRDQVLDVIEGSPQHQYQVLTKRENELLRYSRR